MLFGGRDSKVETRCQISDSEDALFSKKHWCFCALSVFRSSISSMIYLAYSRCRGTFITTLVSSCDAYTTFTVTCTVVQFLYNGGDNASGW